MFSGSIGSNRNCYQSKQQHDGSFPQSKNPAIARLRKDNGTRWRSNSDKVMPSSRFVKDPVEKTRGTATAPPSSSSSASNLSDKKTRTFVRFSNNRCVYARDGEDCLPQPRNVGATSPLHIKQKASQHPATSSGRRNENTAKPSPAHPFHALAQTPATSSPATVARRPQPHASEEATQTPQRSGNGNGTVSSRKNSTHAAVARGSMASTTSVEMEASDVAAPRLSKSLTRSQSILTKSSSPERRSRSTKDKEQPATKQAPQEKQQEQQQPEKVSVISFAFALARLVKEHKQVQRPTVERRESGLFHSTRDVTAFIATAFSTSSPEDGTSNNTTAATDVTASRTSPRKPSPFAAWGDASSQAILETIPEDADDSSTIVPPSKPARASNASTSSTSEKAHSQSSIFRSLPHAHDTELDLERRAYEKRKNSGHDSGVTTCSRRVRARSIRVDSGSESGSEGNPTEPLVIVERAQKATPERLMHGQQAQQAQQAQHSGSIVI